MQLSPGTQLGPYEILSPIGAGGMGEVYKARDTRLNRIVAIKTSAEQFSDRFHREARAVAALNHPHVCTLYDVGPNYLVMEYLEGQPIQGPQPLDKVLKWGIQICEALDAAHRKGITHRDLKPANILTTKSGIKLLDFGLAKSVQSIDSTDATLTSLTQDHTILGTLHYMSPEQLEGREIDSRSDIFSFGVVLYELLTGKHAFGGSSQASVIAATLQNEVPSVDPPALNRVLQRCLAKNPDDRWQSARDLRAALAWIAESRNEPATATPSPSSKKWWLVGAVAAAALLATAAGMSKWRDPSATPGPLSRFSIYPPPGTAFSRTVHTTVPIPQFAVSPDGRFLVMAAAQSKPMLWLRPIEELDSRIIPGTESASNPFWSPDSNWIGFFADGKMKKVPVGGGQVQVIKDGAGDNRGASWRPDGTILVGLVSDSILTISAVGGEHYGAAPGLEHRSSPYTNRYPLSLPDGKHFLFTRRSSDPNQQGILLMSADGKRNELLIRSDSSAHFAPPNHLLWVNGGTLLAQTFNVERLALAGQPVAIAEGIGRSSTGLAAVSLSNTGILTHAGKLALQSRISWFDRSGQLLESPIPDGDHIDFRLSPDESHLATSSIDAETGNVDIWITDLMRRSTSRFTTWPNVDASPIWSPDGTKIVYRSNRIGRVELYQKNASGVGADSLVLSVKTQVDAGMLALNSIAGDWSPDGKHIAFSSSSGDDKFGVAVFSTSGEPSPRRFPATAGQFSQGHPNFSPDGRFIAYQSDETGRTEVYVEAFKPPEGRWKVSTNGGAEPRWRADGKEIYYLSDDRKLMAVPVANGPSFGLPVVLFQTDIPLMGDLFRSNYVPSRDGKRFLVNTRSGNAPPAAITVVLNWTNLLKK